MRGLVSDFVLTRFYVLPWREVGKLVFRVHPNSIEATMNEKKSIKWKLF